MATLTTPDTVSMDPGKLQQAMDLFHQQIAGRWSTPARVWRCTGTASWCWTFMEAPPTPTPGVPWTMRPCSCCSPPPSPLAACCLYILKQRGKVNWDDPVAKHWPEFAENGKEDVTVRHILSHRGGFPDTPADLPWTDWADWSKVTRAMERAVPKYPSGEVLAYHPINYGWVIAELVRRIDGRTFDRFLADELAAPLQMDSAYVNLPPALDSRVSRIHVMEDDADTNGFTPWCSTNRRSTTPSLPEPTASPPPETWPAFTPCWSGMERWTACNS